MQEATSSALCVSWLQTLLQETCGVPWLICEAHKLGPLVCADWTTEVLSSGLARPTTCIWPATPLRGVGAPPPCPDHHLCGVAGQRNAASCLQPSGSWPLLGAPGLGAPHQVVEGWLPAWPWTRLVQRGLVHRGLGRGASTGPARGRWWCRPSGGFHMRRGHRTCLSGGCGWGHTISTDNQLTQFRVNWVCWFRQSPWVACPSGGQHGAGQWMPGSAPPLFAGRLGCRCARRLGKSLLSLLTPSPNL